ncbi:MAG: hypothetical protein IJ624_06560 [Prevotella sp.]|nr:hypothetical protein [Prevotella sp.]
MKRIVLFALLLFGAYPSKAQLKGEDFSDYSEYVAEVYDISWEKPSGFSLFSHILDFEKATHVNGMGVSPLQSMYGYGFISYDKECILLFPYMDVMGSTISSFPNARKSNKYNKLDCKKIAPKHEMETYSKEGWNELFITRLYGKTSKFNADLTTIVRTEMKTDMQKSIANYYGVKELFPYSTTVFCYDKNHVGMYFRLMLTARGKRLENEYLQRLYDAVRYMDTPNYKYDDKKNNILRHNRFIRIEENKSY